MATPARTVNFSWGDLRRPCLMGIVNVTPNSFSDGGRYFDPAAAVGQSQRLANAGAQVIDLGAEASSFFRPGVQEVEAEEQLRRLAAVIPQVARLPGIFVSVDTRSARVARAAESLGAAIVNDISAGEHDPHMFETVAQLGMKIVLMHIGAGYPATPQENVPDILASVRDYLASRIEAAAAAGIARDQIAIDPGIGFGKTMEDNWTLVFRCHELATLGVPVVLGASRKRFLDTTPPPHLLGEKEWRAKVDAIVEASVIEHPGDGASAAITAIAASNGVQIHRVHNVTLSARALRIHQRHT